MIQFTFRLYEFTSFLFAFIAAINYGVVIKNFGLKDVVVLSLIATLLLIPYKSKLDFDAKYKEEDLLEPKAVTQDTGRVHAGMASMEYLPSKAYEVLNTYVATREDIPIIINNKEDLDEAVSIESYAEHEEDDIIDDENYTGEGAKITNYEKNGSSLSFILSDVKENTIIELPYIYYLGYRVYANGEKIGYVESDNGFVQIEIEPEAEKENKGNQKSQDIEENNQEAETNVEIKVKYLGTNAMIFAFIISIVSAILLICSCYFSKIIVK